ncbi:hypothetical protein M0R72_02000 [Candidatus Pacearchaeota archaeon]|jgi:hypothetical protein|nr:hypothetical protein [Candidatus Pacearchaeota archaeon]
MVVNISKEDLELVELQKLAEKGIKSDELEDVVSEYEAHSKKQTTHDSFEAIKEQYKREKAQDNFEKGTGGFKRAT